MALSICVRFMNLGSIPRNFLLRNKEQPAPRTQWGTFTVLERVRHDPHAFTQGLVYQNETHYWESTGLYGGRSDLRRVQLRTGHVEHRHQLADEYFGEGLAYIPVSDQLIQLTWREGVAFLYDAQTLKLLANTMFPATTTQEGWGITTDGHVLYVSDGSPYLHVWNATTLEEQQSRILVKSSVDISSIRQWSDDERRRALSPETPPSQWYPVRHLNELEWDPRTETILANVWYKDCIVRIDPRTGLVLAIYNLHGLYTPRATTADCLNGIMVVPTTQQHTTTSKEDNDMGTQVWVTGKLWPYMYSIKLIDE